MGLLALLWRNGYRTALEGTMSCILSTKNSPREKGLTDICEAFLHGKEHTTSGSPSCPHFTPGPYALYFPLFFSALKRSSLLSIPPSCSMDGRLQDFREDFAGAVSIWIVRLWKEAYQWQACEKENLKALLR